MGVYVSMCLYTQVLKGWKSVLDPLELELQVVVCYPVKFPGAIEKETWNLQQPRLGVY